MKSVKKAVLSHIPVLLLVFVMLVCSNPNLGTVRAHGRFSDVKDTDWYYNDVDYVSEKGLMNGTDGNLFSPLDTTTRAMIVTVLWRMDGQISGKNPAFSDVKADAYYYGAVAWAAENNIVSGYSESVFGSDDPITREQLAAIIYRYAQYKGYDCSVSKDLSVYKDYGEISPYAAGALSWANAAMIITGTSEDTVSPSGEARRCQVAAILKRFCAAYRDKNNTTSAAVTNTGVSHSSGGGSSSQSAQSANNTKKAEITVGNAQAKPGDDVYIEVSVNNNPGILGMTLSINYDADNLSLEKAENGEVFAGVLDFTSSGTLFPGARFVWDGIELEQKDIKNGTFLIMSFHIPETAKEGTYPISFDYRSGDVVDNNLSAIELSIKTGSITVKN